MNRAEIGSRPRGEDTLGELQPCRGLLLHGAEMMDFGDYFFAERIDPFDRQAIRCWYKRRIKYEKITAVIFTASDFD